MKKLIICIISNPTLYHSYICKFKVDSFPKLQLTPLVIHIVKRFLHISWFRQMENKAFSNLEK